MPARWRRPIEGRSLAEVLGKQAADGLLGPDPPARLRVAKGLELRPVVSRAENSQGHRLTQILFQDVTEEASGRRRARAWALAVLIRVRSASSHRAGRGGR